MKCQVFYAELLLKDFEFDNYWFDFQQLRDLPHGAYYRYVEGRQWYDHNHTPVEIEDVPKKLIVLALLLN